MYLQFTRVWAFLALLAGCSEQRSDKPMVLDLSDPEAAVAEAESMARSYLSAADRAHGVEDLVVRQRMLDTLGIAHIRMDQRLGGVPVFGAQTIVHVPADGNRVWMTDGLARDVQVDTRPQLTADQALAFARNRMEGPVDQSAVDLQILRHEGLDYLTWRVQIWSMSGDTPAMPVMFVDAHRGDLVWEYSNLQTAKDRDTHDANNGTSLPGTLARQEGDAAILDDAVDDAHDFAGVAYDYYDIHLGRDSYDDAGITITSVAHYSTSYDNAFWNGSQLVYGDGGTFFTYLSGALDVVAHELTHAVTENTAGLIYANESGGLNEATSDILGAVVEAYDDGWTVSNDTWLVGEDITQPILGSALRYMDDPTLDGNSIDDYDDYTAGMSVHNSSGIANRAFVEWESDASVTMEEAGDIWYRALAHYMTPSTTFQQARLATEQAARDLFGSTADEVDAVTAGWDLVDVRPGNEYRIFSTTTNISASTGTQLNYTFTPDANADAVRFLLIGDDPDADLYVRFGAAPTTSTYDCRSITNGSRELCEIDPSSTGTYHVMIDAWSTFSDLTLTAWEYVPCDDADGDGVTTCDGDCDDTNANVNPDADEVCNDIDDDCNGTVDGPLSVDAATWYQDGDGDGFGNLAVDQRECVQPTGYVSNSTDCDDAVAEVNPNATEVCNDIDDDCSGEADGLDAVDIITWFEDTDADGYGDSTVSQQACDQPEGFVLDDTDCDDQIAEINPGLPEVCDDNDVDENCNGVAEEEGALGAEIYLVDADLDGYGEFGNFVVACQTGEGIVELDGDCNDADDSVYPGAPEDCDDRRDTNCDGFSGADDLDGDGFAACDECDDGSAARYPGADEICDGLDNDCDQEVDNEAIDAVVFYVDADGDGFGDTEIRACGLPDNAAEQGGDCDDDNRLVFPGAFDVANDGIDQDCDGADRVVEGGGPDGGGPDQGDGSLGVGCGCTSTSPGPVPWMVLGLGLMVARRRL